MATEKQRLAREKNWAKLRLTSTPSAITAAMKNQPKNKIKLAMAAKLIQTVLNEWE